MDKARYGLTVVCIDLIPDVISINIILSIHEQKTKSKIRDIVIDIVINWYVIMTD